MRRLAACALLAACSATRPLPTTSAAGAAAPAEASAAAQSGLGAFLERIPAGAEASYGFADRAALERARLGLPYEIWSAAADGALVREPSWRFPVIVDGRLRALLAVTLEDGAWKAVDLGAAGLALELDRLERERAPSSQARRLLVRAHRLHVDFAAFLAPGTPLEEARFDPIGPSAPEGPLGYEPLRAWLRERLPAAPAAPDRAGGS